MAVNLQELDLSQAGSWPLPMKIMAIAMVCIAVMIGVYFLDTKEQQKELKQAQSEENILKQQLIDLHDKTVNLAAYRQQMIDMEKQFNQLLKRLPSATEMPDLLDDISRTALTSGLGFQSIEPLAQTTADFYVEQALDINIEGDYHQMGDFVSKVSNLPRIVTLHDFNIEKPEENPLAMRIKAKIYHYIEFSEDVDTNATNAETGT